MKTRINEVNQLKDKILKEIETWSYYNAILFRIVFLEGIGMRKLSHESGIPVSSISNTMKLCKEKLRIKFGEDYLIYKNILKNE